MIVLNYQYTGQSRFWKEDFEVGTGMKLPHHEQKEEFMLVTAVKNKLPSYQPQHRTLVTQRQDTFLR